ncbi:MAG: SPOR domain-containing protein, partial [Rhodothermales bacterium]
VEEDEDAVPTPILPVDAIRHAEDLPPQPPPHRLPPKEEKRRSIFPWMVLVFVVAVIGVSAVWYFDLFPASTTEGPAQAAIDTPTTDDGTSTQAGLAEDSTETGTEGSEDAAVPPVEGTPEETETPDAPAIIDPAIDGYTIVVYSSTTLSDAEAAADRYRQRLDDPTVAIGVLAQTSEGITRYRLGVGQTASDAEAFALKRRLGDALPSDAWVIRINRITDQ